MTPLFFQDEVFLDCSKDLDTSACTFTFKGKEIYLQHTLEIKPKQRVHRMTCKVDGQTFNFGAGRSTLGGGTFGTWPKIMIEGIPYRFRINWSTGEGQKGVKFEAENNPKQLSDVLQVEKTLILTTLDRFKLTTPERSMLTTPKRSMLTT